MKRTVITERDLLEFSRCGLRLFGNVNYYPIVEEQIAGATWKWLTQAEFSGARPSLPRTREVYDQFCAEQEMDDVDRKRCLRIGPRASRRLHDLLSRAVVVQPVTPYDLPFTKAGVTGEYSVITIKGRKERMIVRLHLNNTRVGRPDVMSMSRWLHLRTFERSPARVYNYVVGSDSTPWTESFEEAVTRSMLNSTVASVLADSGYPAPGSFCESCQTAACMRAIELRAA